MAFQCQQCGCCCKSVGRLIHNLPLPVAVVLAPDINGWCHHLKERPDGLYECDIYDKRPTICRAEWMADNTSAVMGLNRDYYYAMMRSACEQLRKESKL